MDINKAIEAHRELKRLTDQFCSSDYQGEKMEYTEKTVKRLLFKILQDASEANADPAKVAIAPEVAKILLCIF